MKRNCSIALLCLAAGLHGEIIDRIAVSVGNQAITTSDIEREIRVAAFLNRTPPDLSAANRRTTADRMVDQRLILRELENNRYPEPASAEIDSILQKFVQDNFANEQAWRTALDAAGISEQNLRDELLWQRRMLLFIDIRFRPAVQVTAEEIQDYFDKVVEPAAEVAHPGQPVKLDDYREQIQEKLAGDQVDKQLASWLENARKRSDVVFHPEAFQ